MEVNRSIAIVVKFTAHHSSYHGLLLLFLPHRVVRARMAVCRHDSGLLNVTSPI